MNFKAYYSNSIKNKAVLAFMGPLVLIVIFIAIFYPARQKAQSMRYAETQVRTLSEMLSVSVGAGLYDSNFDLVQSTFEWIKKDPNIDYTAIIDESETPMIEHNPKSQKIDYKTIRGFGFDNDEDHFQASAPIVYKGKNFGRIVMVYSLQSVVNEINTGLWTSIGVGIALLIVGRIFILFIFSSITKGIIQLRDAAKLAATGNLNVHVNHQSTDEVGELAASFGQMVGNIKNLMKEVHEATAAVASASTQISSSTEELAAGSQEQSTQTSEVAAAIEEMTRTLEQGSAGIQLAAQSAQQAGEDAQQGGKVVGNTILGMRRISDVVYKSAEQVKVLGTSSDKIGEIIGVIDDIADQTNLLALNAAIEAARAGEQGRGFAVVADEVRKLAERTSKATKEIAVMIRQIQDDTGQAVSSMKKGTEEVTNGISMAEEAGNMLRNIVASASSVADMIQQIASASKEQTITAGQISKNVDAISAVTQESASGTQQIARTAEDLNRLTENLQNLIDKFDVSSDHTHHQSVNGSANRYTGVKKTNTVVNNRGRIIKV
ncbi:MAG: methyl-accepting chemotaxis protein [Bacteroidota bacterium]